MIDQSQLGALRGSEVHDSSGARIGKIGQVWMGRGDRPDWISVKTGLFGLNESLVPLQDADVEDDRVRVPYDKDRVKNAPNVDADADEPLTNEQVDQLYEYYDLGTGGTGGAGGTDAGYPETSGRYAEAGDRGEYAAPGETGRQQEGYDRRTSGDDAMTRSEERLNVGTQTQPTGTARLRKYVTTENVQQTVPVQREHVRLEREPITDANRGEAYGGPDITESEHEVTLHEERPVVDKETVPVERVRLGKETVTDEETISEQARREEIDSDVPDGSRRR